ncbi:MAG: uncharacterized protein A8A55_2586, partial [Amphiamblys sp. WSBS2006]
MKSNATNSLRSWPEESARHTAGGFDPPLAEMSHDAERHVRFFTARQHLLLCCEEAALHGTSKTRTRILFQTLSLQAFPLNLCAGPVSPEYPTAQFLTAQNRRTARRDVPGPLLSRPGLGEEGVLCGLRGVKETALTVGNPHQKKRLGPL